ncbi:MAG: Ig domain-containing protein [Acidimicrobiales bacterium]
MRFVHNGHPSNRKLVRISAIAIASLGLLGVASVALSASASASAGTPTVSKVGELGACTANTGVIVYVDFGSWPSGPEKGAQDIGCAPTPGATQTQSGTTSGVMALNAAGYTLDGTKHYGDAFVCRLGVKSLGIASQEPTPTQESCLSTPDDYWSYWHADAGSDTWSFSGGATTTYPYAGSIDAWTFEPTGGTTRPTLTPDQVQAEEGTSLIPPALTITPTRLMKATVDQGYSASLSASGGKGPYGYAVNTQGPDLPAGLTLSSSGVLSGTPTETGNVNFVVDVTAAPITKSNPHMSPPEGYTGPNLGTIAVHISVKGGSDTTK